MAVYTKLLHIFLCRAMRRNTERNYSRVIYAGGNSIKFSISVKCKVSYVLNEKILALHEKWKKETDFLSFYYCILIVKFS